MNVGADLPKPWKLVLLAALLAAPAAAADSYTNFETAHVDPLALTPSKERLLAVNTPDAKLEVFEVWSDGALWREAVIPVGLEPVSVAALDDGTAWVVNHVSDSVSVVDLEAGRVVRTLRVGDEPTDVAFANGRAFVSLGQEDRILAYDLADLDAEPASVELPARYPRALAVSPDGSEVYAVALHSGNQTTVVGAGVIFEGRTPFNPIKLDALGLNEPRCWDDPPAYPPLPPGIVRNPDLTDPADGIPKVGLIVEFNRETGRWEDETGADWSACLNFRMPDRDLFAIDPSTLDVQSVAHLGTTLFDVAPQPGTNRVWVPNTDARNSVRFEHPLGLEGHVVDNRLSVVDAAEGTVTARIDLNTHIDRSNPDGTPEEREASIAQPGAMVWTADGSEAYLTGLGSRKVFRVDGSCLDGSCIFGEQRALPDAVNSGQGPSGLALLESAGRLFVMHRFTNRIATVDLETMDVVDERSLLDPSPEAVKEGRRLLYDGIRSSAHGDASCASCHVFGDTDMLAWDLGDPAREFDPYDDPEDKIRFFTKSPGGVEECPPGEPGCSDHTGFDPQKGPMVTQTLRAMVGPLHWRGDRNTVEEFNATFVELLGKKSLSSTRPAGLTESEMQRLKRFLHTIAMQPNPHRNVDDSLPDREVQIPGHPVSGNPSLGRDLYLDAPLATSNNSCVDCHRFPFGTLGGKLGGIGPSDPRETWAALMKGDIVASKHSDMKVPQIRTAYQKAHGPRFGRPEEPLPEAKVGVGFAHDGRIPDLATFFTGLQFQATPEQIRHVSTFVMHFPTGTKPAVGQQVTLPPGTPPTGSPEEESLLDTLVALGDAADADRHCDLVAHADAADGETRGWSLSGGAFQPDAETDPAVSLTELRESAAGPITFTCGTKGSGVRLGIDRDLDSYLDRDDCRDDNADAWSPPPPVTSVRVEERPDATRIQWPPPEEPGAAETVFDVLAGDLETLISEGSLALDCLGVRVPDLSYTDSRPDPPPGAGHYYLVRSVNDCGAGPLGKDRDADVPCEPPEPVPGGASGLARPSTRAPPPGVR